MILLSSTRLEAALARGQLTDWDKTKYMLLGFAVAALFAPAAALIRPRFGPEAPLLNVLAGFVGAILSVVVVVNGFRRCFEINRSIDGDRFIERSTVLLIPITIRVVIFLLPASIAAGWFVGFRQEQHPSLYRYYPVAIRMIAPLVTCLYYWLLARSLRRLQHKVAEQRGIQQAVPADD